MSGRFELSEPPKTEMASEVYLKQLDAQIDELDTNLARVRETRRVVAELIGANRRQGGPITRLVDNADRAHFEGGTAARSK